MKRSVICLVLIGSSLLAGRLTYAQEGQVPVENDSSWTNQADNAVENYLSAENQASNNDLNETAPETQGNSDMTDMPLNTDNNSVNSAS